MNNPTKPYITIVAPCYNEEAILKGNVETIINYMDQTGGKFRWEILIINDGSSDKSGIIADELAIEHDKVRVIHHPTNLNLGNALQTGFKNAKGDIIVVLDIDLSYGVEYVEVMTEVLVEKTADIVIASPYMKGGQVTGVPFTRKMMSRWVNRFMRFAAQDKYHTFTGMVRAYRKSFIQSVNLKTRDYEINPEIIYKAMILRARIVEVPAHLDWTEQNKHAGKRTSSLRMIRGFFSGLMSAFIFRPYIFFMGIGVVLLILSLYQLIWLLVDTLSAMGHMGHVENPFSDALSFQFKKNPQSFLIGGITFLAAIQFLSLGFVSLQNKRYFEELFHMGTAIKKDTQRDEA